MSERPALPDLSKLTDIQKDELIIQLWETLVATDVALEVKASGGEIDSDSRVSAVYFRGSEHRAGHSGTASPRATRTGARSRIGLGRGMRLLSSRVLLGVLLVIACGFVVDFSISRYQQRAMNDRRRATLELENAALGRMFVELVRVDHEQDGRSYRATISMRNSDPQHPLYVMLNPVRAFVQTGLTWQEVASKALPGADRGVIQLDGAHDLQMVFQADVADWAELMPGYMHVRIESDMLVSRSNEPKDDIVERNNRFYVYLKPHGADDAAIMRRSNFPGNPPVFIPMPPH